MQFKMDEIYSDSENEVHFNEQNDNSDESDDFYNMEINEKTKLVGLHEIYGVSVFDVKVAQSIVAIHKKQKNYKFSNWVEKNYIHLHQLYRLSGQLIPMQEFFTFIYDKSY